MTTPAHAKAYETTQVLTAGPERLQLMLYDGALRFCAHGRLALASGDREGAAEALARARQIVLYLGSILRPEAAPELCARVASAYQYVYRRLVDASLNASTEALDDATAVLEMLRSAWADLLARLPAADGTAADGMAAPEPAVADGPRVRLTG